MARKSERRSRLVPVLVLAGVGALLLLGLTPAQAALPSQTGCAYGQCTNVGPSTNYSLWIILLIILVVATLAAVLYLRRRRHAAPAAPTEWTPGPGPLPGPEVAPMAPVGATASYVESPEDVALPPPAATPPGTPAAEPDIDSLMQELDKISGEILKRAAPAKKPGEPSGETATSDEGQGQQQ